MARKRVEPKKTAANKKQGAIRKPSPSTSSKPWGRYFLGFVFLGGLIFGAINVPWQSGYDHVVALTNRPIQHVSVEGEFYYLSKKDIQDILSEKLVNDFVELRIKDLQQEIKKNPWIETVSVHRVWPNSLVVKVREQQPIALWGSEGFINRFGTLIISDDLVKIRHFPKLYGERESSNLIVKQYLELTKMLATQELSITELTIDKTQSMRIKVDASFDVLIGQNNIVDKVNAFLLVYKNQLKIDKNEIAKVDLRYSHGMAVSWRTDATHLLSSQRG